MNPLSRRLAGGTGKGLLLAIILPLAAVILILKFGTRRDLIIEYDGRRIVVEDRGKPALQDVNSRHDDGSTRSEISDTSYWKVRGAYDTYFEWADLRLEIEGTTAKWYAIENGRRGFPSELRLDAGEEAVIGPNNRVERHRMGPVPGDP